jgi:hypothetical protein
MVLTASFVLSLVTGLSCHHHPCDAQRHHLRDAQGIITSLNASVGASGPHDFAVRKQARFVSARRRVHRIPHSTFVTIAIRPSDRGGTAECIVLILANGEAVYFYEMGWTGIRAARPSGKSGGG